MRTWDRHVAYASIMASFAKGGCCGGAFIQKSVSESGDAKVFSALTRVYLYVSSFQNTLLDASKARVSSQRAGVTVETLSLGATHVLVELTALKNAPCINDALLAYWKAAGGLVADAPVLCETEAVPLRQDCASRRIHGVVSLLCPLIQAIGKYDARVVCEEALQALSKTTESNGAPRLPELCIENDL